MKLDDPMLAIPDQQVSIDVLLEKYAKGDEATIEQCVELLLNSLVAEHGARLRA